MLYYVLTATSSTLAASAMDCPRWCNAYTCSLDACGGCLTCAQLEDGQYCAGWCSSYVCPYTKFCDGCLFCGAPAANLCDVVEGSFAFEPTMIL